ncbi:hypothetical protein [Erythrobacter sanguineus]|nr:hypothetical protein [Erythrobacter sanguineus]
MNSKLKLWTQLGLGTALAGGMLAACGGEAGGEGGGEAGGDGADAAAVAPSEAGTGEAGEGEAGGEGEGAGGEGEGGEGEGGVAVSRADSDPVAYGIALAVTEAHVIAARDAFAAGRKEAAAEMFAHPAAEVLVEMDPVFAKLGVKDFKPLLTDASTAVLDGKDAAEVNRRYDAIITALRGAADKAPDSGASEAAIASGIIADQIERAGAMYRIAAKDDRYEPYLDGYGFYKVAETAAARGGAAIKAANPDAHARISDALALLRQAYPAATRPGRLKLEPAALSAASSRVMLATAS